MYKNLKIEGNKTINHALRQMDLVRKKLLMVFDNTDFIGLISIGDIQRAIINNVDLNCEISKILRKDIILSKETESLEVIKNKMLSIRAEYMPVIDENNQIVNVYFWEDLFGKQSLPPLEKISFPVVIMAGGKGTRLKPITNVLPKPLIPIGNKPIVEHIMDRFVNVGCNEFLFSVNYKSEFIEYYFNTLENKTYNISFFKEDKPLGTAGSLHLLKDKINSTFFVSNCDIIVDQDYSEIYNYHRENKNELTMVAAIKHYKIPYGTLETLEDGVLYSMQEKPELTYKINAGLYILEPHLLNEIPNNEFFNITNLIQKILDRKGKIGVFPVSEKSWRDIGEWDEYLKNKE